PVLRHRMGRQGDDGQGAPLAAQRRGRGVAVQFGHLHVHQDEVKRLALLGGVHDFFASDAAVFGDRHFQSRLLEVKRDHPLIVPPSISASRLEITSPRPVPPNWRVVEASACANGRKSSETCSGLMPMPLSITSRRRRDSDPGPSWSRLTTTSTPPTFVNLIAL